MTSATRPSGPKPPMPSAKIAEAFEGRMLVGAGTVTTPELVTRTRDAGGQFIISPDTNPAVIARTRELELVSMPAP